MVGGNLRPSENALGVQPSKIDHWFVSRLNPDLEIHRLFAIIRFHGKDCYLSSLHFAIICIVNGYEDGNGDLDFVKRGSWERYDHNGYTSFRDCVAGLNEILDELGLAKPLRRLAIKLAELARLDEDEAAELEKN